MDSDAAKEAGADGSAGGPAPVPKWFGPRYTLILLTFIYILNFIDRQVVVIVAEPIKRDLGLADWQIGMMTGLAFALLYSTVGIPIARMAERGDRAKIISVAVAVWSAFTALCGVAQNFTQLVLARVGVGVGEAGCTPPALSLITDTVPKERRASSVSVYMSGSSIGGVLGLAIGGILADLYGWRATFLILGLPGLLVALIAAFTIHEPRRRAAPAAGTDAPPGSIRDAFRELSGKRSYWYIVAGNSFMSFVAYGTGAFLASFFFRHYPAELEGFGAHFGLGSTGFLGLALGILNGFAGLAGMLLGGMISDRFARADQRAYMTVPAIAALTVFPIELAVLFLGPIELAFFFVIPLAFAKAMWIGPVYATVQGLVRPGMRATATAIMLLISNLFGLGLGPLLVGILSDLMMVRGGLSEADALQFSLACFGALALPGALVFWLARRTLREDLAS